MFTIFRNPAKVKNELSFDFSFCWQCSISFNSQRSKDDVTLLIPSVSLNKEPSFFESSIDGNFFAFPVVGFMIIKRMNEIGSCLFVWDSVNKLFLSLIIFFSNKVLEVVVDSSNKSSQSQGYNCFWSSPVDGRLDLSWSNDLIS